MLSNIETPSEKLLPLVLVGQPEFAERLNLPSLRQLKQRVALRCELGTLSAEETAAYIAGRVRIAGARRRSSSPAMPSPRCTAARRGVPRTISVICDNALVNGFALEHQARSRPTSSARCARTSTCADAGLRRLQPPTPSSALPSAATASGARPRPTPRSAPSSHGGVHSRTAPDPATTVAFGSFTKKRRFSFF